MDDPRAASFLASEGYFVVGFDAKAYLSGFTTSSATLTVEDVPRDYAALVDYAAQGAPGRPLLVGVSEGGLVTALAVEKFPDVFSGGLAMCGPVGDMRGQINYWGDFRVVFDTFFPGALPLWSPENAMIPPQVMAGWEAAYAPSIAFQLSQNPLATAQLLSVTQAPIDPTDPTSIIKTVLGILWYNVFATNNGMAVLRGQPFDNSTRVYLGSANDGLLNSTVQRFDADRLALNKIASHYQTSGALQIPLVTLHTTGDPIVPYWHESLYGAKVAASGSAPLYDHIPIVRYGHCSFTIPEVLVAFQMLVLQVTGQGLANVNRALPDAAAQADRPRWAHSPLPTASTSPCSAAMARQCASCSWPWPLR